MQLTPDQSHYLTTVLRRKNNEFRVFDGTNGEWLCRFADGPVTTTSGGRKSKSIRKAPLMAECTLQLRQQQEKSSSPNVFFAPIKKQRAKLLMEKCTELGAMGFGLVATDFANEKGLNVNKLMLQAVQASEQSER